MIVPRRTRDDGRRRFIVTASTVVVMLGSYTGLRSTPVPAFGSGAAIIRQLDPLFVERYSAPPVADPEEETVARSANEEEAALDREVGSAIEELERRFGGSDAPTSRTAAGERTATNGGISADRNDDRFRAVFGEADAIPDLPPRAGAIPERIRATGNAARGGGGIAIAPHRPGAGRVVEDVAEATAAPVVVAVGADGRTHAPEAPTEVIIHEYRPETFQRTDVALLSDWMTRNPADLPVGVKVHLRQQPTFLTAAMPLVSGDREIELYLMFNPGLRELHIVLVEGDRSVYLIDRGFKEQSRSLREGTVRRLDGEIVAVDSHAGAASSDRAGEFYSIFLSWWEVAKTDAH